MSIALIAVFVVLLVSQALPGLAAWRRIDRLWVRWRALGERWRAVGHGPGGVLWLCVPVLAVGALQAWLSVRWWGLMLLPFGVFMLFLCWGPRDLDADATALAEAEDEPARRQARGPLGLGEQGSSGAAVAGLFRAGLSRWFGPLLWFILLGGAGALLFRLTVLATREPPPVGSPLELLRRLLETPVAALMTLSLALVAHFDAVLKAWRRWHTQPAHVWWGSDPGFLDAAAQASVACELQEEAEDDAADAAEARGEGVVAPPSDAVVPTLQAAVEDSLSLLRRILVLWMALLAVAVLGGIAG